MIRCIKFWQKICPSKLKLFWRLTSATGKPVAVVWCYCTWRCGANLVLSKCHLIDSLFWVLQKPGQNNRPKDKQHSKFAYSSQNCTFSFSKTDNGLSEHKLEVVVVPCGPLWCTRNPLRIFFCDPLQLGFTASPLGGPYQLIFHSGVFRVCCSPVVSNIIQQYFITLCYLLLTLGKSPCQI